MNAVRRPRRGARVAVVNATGRPVPRALLVRAVRAALAREPLSFSIVVAVVSGPRMRALHRRALGKRSETDVLAYPLERSQDALHGEIAVCRDVARREAARRGHAVSAELALYAVHGALHLAGYDDHAPRARRRMWKRQADVLSSLGIVLRG